MIKSFCTGVTSTLDKLFGALWAIVLLAFAPERLVTRSLNDRSMEEEAQKLEETGYSRSHSVQFRYAIGKIRRELLRSFLIAVSVMCAALITAGAVHAYGVEKTQTLKTVLQYGGIAILLLATLGRVEAGITTYGQGTLPEKVNARVYELLYCVGSYALVLSVAL